MSCFWRNVSLRHLQSPANNGAEQLLPGPSRGGRRISHTVKDGPSQLRIARLFRATRKSLGMIFAIDGEPVAAVVTNNAVHGPTDVAFSSALIYAGVPEHPEGHDMVAKSLRVFALR